MKYLMIALIGAISNRVRGGGHGFLRDRLDEDSWLHKILDGKILNALAFGITFGMLQASWHFGLLAAVMMIVGQSLPWGEYIIAIGGWRNREWADVPQIDRVIARFRDDQLKWGLAGLTLRGGIWGLMFVGLFQSFIPLIGGLLMGVSYWAAFRSVQKFTDNQDYAWTAGELFFGAVLWSSCYLSLVI